MNHQNIITVLLCTFLCLSAQAQEIRTEPPIILAGSELPLFQNLDPHSIVGFRLRNGQWEQMPVQVDERDLRLIQDLYNGTINDNFQLQFLVYTDPETFTGSDNDPTFDENDELVFMAKDAGNAYSGQPLPTGTLSGGLEVHLYDPLTDAEAYFYLFEQDGTLDQDAGADYVDYSYSLLNGEFQSAYTINFYNPENSIVQTDYYIQRFSDDWIRDVLKIYAGNANGTNILDQAKILLGPGICNRSIDTYSQGAGIHIASKDGPVRAIRSIMGANSGPLIERNQFFYEKMDEIDFYVRLHFIRGFLRFFDFSENAIGMRFYDAYNQNGVAIDGSPDPVNEWEVSDWSLVSGPQGSLLRFDEIQTTFPVDTFLTYYVDDSSPDAQQCTGDSKSIGASGHWLLQEIPDTDPRSGSQEKHFYKETSYFLKENLKPADIEQKLDEQAMALEVNIRDLSLTSTVEVQEEIPFRLFPNPSADGTVTVAFPQEQGPLMFTLYSLDGRQLFQQQLRSTSTLTLPAQIGAGFYLAEMRSAEMVKTEKWVLR